MAASQHQEALKPEEEASWFSSIMAVAQSAYNGISEYIAPAEVPTEPTPVVNKKRASTGRSNRSSKSLTSGSSSSRNKSNRRSSRPALTDKSKKRGSTSRRPSSSAEDKKRNRKERAETTLSEMSVLSAAKPVGLISKQSGFSWVVFGEGGGDGGDSDNGSDDSKMPQPVYLSELKHEQQEPKWQDLETKTRRASEKIRRKARLSGRISLSHTELGHNELFFKAYKTGPKPES
jgi:hypothetical protein